MIAALIALQLAASNATVYDNRVFATPMPVPCASGWCVYSGVAPVSPISLDMVGLLSDATGAVRLAAPPCGTAEARKAKRCLRWVVGEGPMRERRADFHVTGHGNNVNRNHGPGSVHVVGDGNDIHDNDFGPR